MPDAKQRCPHALYVESFRLPLAHLQACAIRRTSSLVSLKLNEPLYPAKSPADINAQRHYSSPPHKGSSASRTSIRAT